jgi:hypothetical protein
MFKNNALRTNYLQPYPHYIFTQDPSILGYLGYETDVISSVSLTLPPHSQRSTPRREKYEQVVQRLQALYASTGGTYASGDEYGQYVHISLRGKEEEHEQLCLELGEEWLSLLSSLAPSAPAHTEEELASRARFLASFQRWIRERARKEMVFVGADVDGFEALMYTHLHPNAPSSVLDGRRIAATEGGRVGVVPAQAREGDVVVYLAGCDAAIAVRRIAARDDARRIDRAIRAQFESKLGDLRGTESPYVQDFARLVQEEKEGTIEHGRVIGECYVEGIVGWLINEVHDYKIFALH